MPNRLYDGVLFKKPIVATQGTYLGEVVKKYEIGIIINESDNDIIAVVENYLNKFNVKKFNENCNKFLMEVNNEQEKYIEALNLFVSNV